MTDHDTMLETHMYGDNRVHPDPFIEMGRVLARTEAVPAREPYQAPHGWADRHRGALPDADAMARWLIRNLTPEQSDMWLRQVQVEVAKLAGEDRAETARKAGL